MYIFLTTRLAATELLLSFCTLNWCSTVLAQSSVSLCFSSMFLNQLSRTLFISADHNFCRVSIEAVKPGGWNILKAAYIIQGSTFFFFFFLQSSRFFNVNSVKWVKPALLFAHWHPHCGSLTLSRNRVWQCQCSGSARCMCVCVCVSWSFCK